MGPASIDPGRLAVSFDYQPPLRFGLDDPKAAGRGDGHNKEALQDAIASIEKSYGKGSIMRLGEDTTLPGIKAISTGALSLDIALGVGGIPRGRIIEIYGPESSGKTTLTLQAIAEGLG